MAGRGPFSGEQDGGLGLRRMAEMGGWAMGVGREHGMLEKQQA